MSNDFYCNKITVLFLIDKLVLLFVIQINDCGSNDTETYLIFNVKKGTFQLRFFEFWFEVEAWGFFENFTTNDIMQNLAEIYMIFNQLE